MDAVILQFPAMAKTDPEAPMPNRLRELRKARGLTLQALGAPPVGIHYGHLQKLETGARELSVPIMERVARGLGVPMADLLNLADGGLTAHERALIEAYRRLPATLRSAIDGIAASQAPGEVHALPERKAG